MYIGPPILLVGSQFGFDHSGFISVKGEGVLNHLQLKICWYTQNYNWQT